MDVADRLGWTHVVAVIDSSSSGGRGALRDVTASRRLCLADVITLRHDQVSVLSGVQRIGEHAQKGQEVKVKRVTSVGQVQGRGTEEPLWLPDPYHIGGPQLVKPPRLTIAFRMYPGTRTHGVLTPLFLFVLQECVGCCSTS